VLAVRVIPRPVDELELLAPREQFASAEQNKSFRRTQHISVRVFPDAPTGARAERPDLSVPQGREPKPSAKRTPVAKTARHRTLREETTRQVPAPAKPVAATVGAPQPSPATVGGGRTSLADLEAMSVVKLRQYARLIKNLPIQGRQISMANKTQLLEAIKAAE